MNLGSLRIAPVALLLALPTAAQTFLGPTPYLSTADSPFALGSAAFALEDFEDGALDVPGVSAPIGIVASTQFSGTIIDSVDADDGVIDGACAGGDSFFSQSATVRFVFDAVALGGLPRKAGLVWTDGGPNATVTFEARDADGASLGTLIATGQGDGTNFGTTGEDRFYGVEFAGGIGELVISHTAGGIEIDHLQYELFCSALAVTSYCTAGTSAAGCTATLASTGTPSGSAGSGFTVTASNVEGKKDGLYFYGFNGAQANSWGNGTSYQCVVPPAFRTPAMPGVGTASACNGSFSLDLNAFWAIAGPNKVPLPGQQINLQLWYRDPGSTSNQTTSLSDALEFIACE